MLSQVVQIGDYVYPYPIGLPVTLQYSDKGRLWKIFEGFTDFDTELTDRLIDTITQKHCLPLTIKAVGKVSYIRGIFIPSKSLNYVNDVDFRDRQNVDVFIEAYNKAPFPFYAFSISQAVKENITINQNEALLKLNGFEPMKNFIISRNFEEAVLEKQMQLQIPENSGKAILGYVIRRTDRYLYYTENLTPYKVANVEKILVSDGKILGEICTTSDKIFYLPYSTVIKENIFKSSTLIYNDRKELKQIITSNHKRNTIYNCVICGKPIDFLKYTECPDSSCLSHKYFKIKAICEACGAECISFETYKNAAIKKEILSLTDVLLLPEYKDAELSTTLEKLLHAYFGDIPNTEDLDILCEKCDHNAISAVYYIQNPKEIQKDLGINNPYLVNLLSNPVTAQELSLLINESNIHFKYTFDNIVMEDIVGKHIYMTGTFTRAHAKDHILDNYGIIDEKVTAETDMVLVGNNLHGTDNQQIEIAQRYSIPLISENTIFKN